MHFHKWELIHFKPRCYCPWPDLPDEYDDKAEYGNGEFHYGFNLDLCRGSAFRKCTKCGKQTMKNLEQNTPDPEDDVARWKRGLPLK